MTYYAFLLFFVLDYVRPGSYVPGLDLLRLNALVPLCVILGTLFLKTRVSNQEFLADTNTKIMGALLALLVVSMIFADVTMHAYVVLTTVFGYMLMFWAGMRQVHDVGRMKGVFMTLVAVHMAVAALNPVMFTDPGARHYIASGAFLGDGNDFALSVNLVIPFCLFLFLESRNWRGKLVWGAALLLLVLSVVATKSRGGTLALGCVGLYYWLKSDRKVLTATIASLAIAVVLISAPPAYFQRMKLIADSNEGSAQGRLLAWTAGTKMAIANPLLGAGAGHFAITYGQFYRTRTDIPWQTAHSIYFLILGELGVPGITVLLTLIFSNLSRNRRMLRELAPRGSPEDSTDRNLLACLSASLIAFASGGAFLSAVYYPHMYVLAGLLSAGRRMVRARLASPAAGVQPAPATSRRPLGPAGISPEWTPGPRLSARLRAGEGSHA